jgi:AraC-like DNA-binding protein
MQRTPIDYSAISAFSRVFRDRTGLSPKEYRALRVAQRDVLEASVAE